MARLVPSMGIARLLPTVHTLDTIASTCPDMDCRVALTAALLVRGGTRRGQQILAFLGRLLLAIPGRSPQCHFIDWLLQAPGGRQQPSAGPASAARFDVSTAEGLSPITRFTQDIPLLATRSGIACCMQKHHARRCSSRHLAMALQPAPIRLSSFRDLFNGKLKLTSAQDDAAAPFAVGTLPCRGS